MINDLRYAIRMLRRSPGITVVAVLSLALGIGANTAIFSLIDQAILRLLPVRNPEQLVLLSTHGPYWGLNLGPNTFSYPMYRDIRDRNEVFSGVAARFPLNLTVSCRGQGERCHGELVSGNYFEVLGVPSVLGRTFTQEDDIVPGAHLLVVLSFDYWRRSFGADPAILNQTLNVNSHPMTVIGVAARGFRGYEVGRPADVFIPLMMKAQMTPTWNELENRQAWWLNVIARLKPGVERAQAESAINVLHRQMLQTEVNNIKDIEGPVEQFRTQFVNQHLRLLSGDKGQPEWRKEVSKPLFVLMGMVALVLLIACANVAGLLVARAVVRHKEIAVRLSLGAGRARIVRQLLVEGLLLAVCGGALGLLVANWTGEALLNALPFEGITRPFTAQPDLRILGFTTVLSLLTGLLFSLFPALQATRLKLASTLKDEAGAVSASGQQVWFRKALIVGQVALSLVLLVGTGLFARSLYNLQNVDPGLKTDHLISFAIDPSLNGYSQVRMRALFQSLQEKLLALPGVRAVSMAKWPALTGSEPRMTIKVEGYRPREDEGMSPVLNFAGPGYFSAMGIPLVAGREFTTKDGPGSPKVVIINEKMARYFFGDENPIGRHIGHAGVREPVDIEIAGVVKDSKTITVKDDVAQCMYFPYLQDEGQDIMTFYVRTTQQPQEMAGTLRRVVHELDPGLPVFELKSVQTQVSESLFLERMIAMLSASFGLLATLLAAVGLYGVTAHSVLRRTREIGIRLALGATGSDVLRLVMREVAFMAGLGIAIGLPAALALSQVVRAGLFGLTPHDTLTLTFAVALLILVTLLSGFVPARRATKVDPMVALRYE